jgi:hypothetical protein
MNTPSKISFIATKVDVIDQQGNIIEKDDKGNIIEFSYKDYALTVLRNPAEDIDPIKMEALVSVIRLVKNLKPGEKAELDHSDWSTLKHAVANFKTRMVDEDFSDFCKYVKEA